MSSQAHLSNTDRLIKNYEACQRAGVICRFSVGKYTGNGPSVVAALRRRGYAVERLPSGSYEIAAAPQQ